ncbi:MAG TPA: hypothetical protein VGP72_27270 [Planctomycetota bacterium]|jgi:hypothetical protein
MKNLHWCLFVTIAAITALSAEDVKLAFAPSGKEFSFDTGLLKGVLRPEGKSLGLRPVLSGTTPVAGPYGLFSPYRLLTADARFGTACWDWASEAKLLDNGAVQVLWSPDKDHPLEITGVYHWAEAGALDVQFTVKPQQDLKKFELFLASYFAGFPQVFAYVKENPDAERKPGFMEAKKAAGVWQAFVRDDDSASIVADGRWKRPPNPVDWKIMPRYAAPIAIRRDPASGLTAVFMSRPADCFGVLMPHSDEGHRSVYLSLFGRDLKSGESATASARLVIGKNITDQQAIELYEKYAK